MGHAMMSHSGVLRPLARNLTLLGCAVWRLDFRGHGASQGQARFHDWSFDHLVREDWPAAVAWVRAQARGMPVLGIGHSLGGLVALAAQGTGRCRLDAIGVLASGLWSQRGTGLLYGNLRRLAGQATLPVIRWAHRLPARRLGLGSARHLDRSGWHGLPGLAGHPRRPGPRLARGPGSLRTPGRPPASAAGCRRYLDPGSWRGPHGSPPGRGRRGRRLGRLPPPGRPVPRLTALRGRRPASSWPRFSSQIACAWARKRSIRRGGGAPFPDAAPLNYYSR
jgi:hypothetical protein